MKKRPAGILTGLFILIHAGGGGRTRTVSLPTDFESVTSANSITPAQYIQYSIKLKKSQWHGARAGIITVKRPVLCQTGRFFLHQDAL